MKRLLLPVTILCCLYACDPEFDVQDEWEEIPVVYGLLDESDSVQYIRIQKAFLPGDNDARDIAGIEDSNYFDEGEIEVELQAREAGSVIERYTLYPVSVEKKGDGIFHAPGHKLYRTPEGFSIDASLTYRLVIETEKGTRVTSETEILEEGSIASHHPLVSRLALADSNLRVTIIPAPGAAFYGLDIRFNYEEFEAGHQDDAEKKSVEWTAFSMRTPSRGGDVRFNTSFNIIFNVFKPLIPEDSDLRRRAKGLDLVVYGGDRELFDYISVNEPSLSIVEKNPEYSNIENGRGIFSSRSTQSRSFTLEDDLIDAIVEGRFLENRNFIH